MKNVVQSYPLVTTPAAAQAAEFYVRYLAGTITFESSWFYLVEGDGFSIAFMTPEHPSSPPGPETFSGLGLILTLQVADAARAYEELKDKGAPIVYPLTDEPWGQRRFQLQDPSGLILDVVEQTDPAPGFWDH